MIAAMQNNARIWVISLKATKKLLSFRLLNYHNDYWCYRQPSASRNHQSIKMPPSLPKAKFHNSQYSSSQATLLQAEWYIIMLMSISFEHEWISHKANEFDEKGRSHICTGYICRYNTFSLFYLKDTSSKDISKQVSALSRPTPDLLSIRFHFIVN